MKAGNLRHRVDLQSPSTSQDTFGQPNPNNEWSTYDTVWADIRPLKGRELTEAQQVQSEVSHNIVIRKHATVAPEHRVLFDSRSFQIINIINVGERNIEQHLMCVERV